MLKNISAGERTVDEKSDCIRERNSAIKAGQYTVIDGGRLEFGDVIIVGEQHKEAAIYLRDCLKSSLDIKENIEFEKETEDIYDVQIWSSTDFDLSAVV